MKLNRLVAVATVPSQMPAKVIDPKADQGWGEAEQANRVTNKAAEDRILKHWADVLAEHMDSSIRDRVIGRLFTGHTSTE
jgi:hypothetical protein